MRDRTSSWKPWKQLRILAGLPFALIVGASAATGVAGQEGTEQWGQLEGVWDCTVESLAADGSVQRSAATWIWQTALDGAAVRDDYLGAVRDDGSRFRGSALRIYNDKLGEWEVAWIDNATAATGAPKVKLYRATYEDRQIVMRQPDGDPAWRTVFFDIRPDSFQWRNNLSGQRMHCERGAGSTPEASPNSR